MPYIKNYIATDVPVNLNIGNNNKKMGHLLFQLSLTLWNNKTNHIILFVTIKIRHDR